MASLIRNSLTRIGGLLLLGGGYTVYREHQWYRSSFPAGGRTILHLDLEGKPIVEKRAEFSLASYKPQMQLKDAIRAIQYAKNDDRIHGLVVTLPASGSPVEGGFAAIQALRREISAFSEMKPSRAYSPSYGDLGNGTLLYYVASACNHVSISPCGFVSAVGLAIQTSFFKTLLEKNNITFEVVRREEYKNALNSFSHDDYTYYHRKQLRELLESMFSQIVRDIAHSRNLKEKEVKKLINNAPLTARTAYQSGLLDAEQYRDTLFETPMQGGKKKVEAFVAVDKYLTRRHREEKIKKNAKLAEKMLNSEEQPQNKIGIVHLSGQIMCGKDSSGNSNSIMSRDAAELIRKLRKSKSCKAIVLRINSPGGSAIGSEEIWREIQLTKETGKPIVASCGSYAASGGYYIAAPADKIIAEAGTLTGSIGVIAGIPYRKIIDKLIDNFYHTFLQRVADGRNMSLSVARKVAKGRVYTGEMAQKVGLVDEIGGLSLAIERAKEMVADKQGKSVEDMDFDEFEIKNHTLWQKLMSGDMDSVSATILRAAVSTFIESVLSDIGAKTNESRIKMETDIQNAVKFS